jgi:hypothetical protein
MGSVTRTAGGLAAAMLAGAALTATPSAAYAQPVVNVGCGPTKSMDLINAINAANADGDTIRLASFCNYVLTAPAAQVLPTTRGPDGLPIINANISLIGGRSTTISRSSAQPFRILEVAAGAVLRVQNIFISGGDGGANTGGGILNARGNVVLTRTTVTGNTADNGAGISNDSGRLTLDRTIVSDNTTRTHGGGGGGIYNDGSLSLALSLITGNGANTEGGGIYNGQGGQTMAFRTTIDSNNAGANGGGMYNGADGRIVLARTLVQTNRAADGGGIYNSGPPSRATLTGSLVRANVHNNCAPLNTISGCTG